MEFCEAKGGDEVESSKYVHAFLKLTEEDG